MYPLGFLFALGFDTATTISLFGVSAANMSDSVALWQIMSFPLLFTAGMVLADAADGVMMVGAYGWAFVDPARKLTYNLVITAISVLVAFVIGGLQAFALLSEQLALSGGIWDVMTRANDAMALLGFVMVGVFALGWLGSALLARRGAAALEVKAEA
jgi:high-affinity nickel-transport protein